MHKNCTENQLHTYPRVMIAAQSSGTGKTLLTCGLLQLFKNRRKEIRAFKCGPDYIDPMFHGEVLGIFSKNLDPFFCTAEQNRVLFAEDASHTLSIIEGVMGYYDGLGGVSEKASSYNLAKDLNTPVILLVDGRGSSFSLTALVQGFVERFPDSHIEGVIINRISPMLYPRIKAAIEEHMQARGHKLKVLGYMPLAEGLELPSRHLGLCMPGEIEAFREKLNAFAIHLEETLDVEGILELADKAPGLAIPEREVVYPKPDLSALQEEIRIGIAKDEAFNFYYKDNLKVLEALGAKLIPFSPLEDEELVQVDGLYIGGGYPELFAKRLEENVAMREAIGRAVKEGMPILAECGGFMYLQKGLTTKEGMRYEMTGVLSGESVYRNKLVRFGYATFMDEQGRSIRGHEFHYFDASDNGDSFIATKPLTGLSGKQTTWSCGVNSGNITAGFPHFYFPGALWFPSEFLAKCKLYRHKSCKMKNEK